MGQVKKPVQSNYEMRQDSCLHTETFQFVTATISSEKVLQIHMLKSFVSHRHKTVMEQLKVIQFTA